MDFYFSNSLNNQFCVLLYDGRETIVRLNSLHLYNTSYIHLKEGEVVGKINSTMNLLNMEINLDLVLYFTKNEHDKIPFDFKFRFPLFRDEQMLSKVNNDIYSKILVLIKSNDLINL